MCHLLRSWSSVAQLCCAERLQSGVSKAFAALLNPAAQRGPQPLTDTLTTEAPMHAAMPEAAVPYVGTGTALCITN